MTALDARLSELSALAPGWLDTDGRGVSATALRRAELLMLGLRAHRVSTPVMVPTPDGGVQVEWLFESVHAVIEVPPIGCPDCYFLDASSRAEFTFAADTISGAVLWAVERGL